MASPTLGPGKKLGRFLLIEQIGAGGMGVVFRARDENLERDVAIKVLPSGSLENEQARRRFRNEALALSRLNHPNIAAVYDFDTFDGIDFLVLELVGGRTLDAAVAERGLPEGEVIRLGRQLADALDAAHSQGVIHRDLKPGNLRLTADGQLKVLDFGLAQAAPKADTLAEMRTQSNTNTAGTVPYMSPEQLRGQKADARSDIWSAGCVIYEMANGQPPFDAPTSADLVTAILQQQPRRHPRTVAASSGLNDVVLKCLEKDPGSRYQSSRELGIDLQRLAGGMSPSAPHRAGQGLKWVMVAAIVLIGAALTSWWVMRPKVREGEISAIAVLPLANLSGDAQNDYFADGMTEAIITNLSKVKALRVISRTSVMRYKGSNKTLQDIAAELGVQAVVEGSVTRAGDRVRVTAQLVRANPETNLWADDYEGEMRDVLTVQKNVADAVVRQVQVKVTAEDRSRQAGPKQVDPKAYESYLRGRYMLSRVSTAGRLQAMQQFRDAIAADSNYSSPYAGIAELEVFSLPSAEHMPKAREAAERALQIDPDNADAHMALGLVHLYGDWDWDGAQREFERALQLNPSSPNILGRYMIFLWSVGRFDEAIRSGEQARQIDPFSVAVNLDLARAYYFARRHDDAIKQFRKTLELDPSNGLTHQFLGIAYETKGMYPEAVGEIATAAQLNARPQWALKMRQSFASKGFHGFLEQWAAEYEESVKAGRSQSWSLGIVYAQLGNKDKAFEWLNKAVREKDRAVVLTKAEPQSDFLRNDPRFGEITKRVGFR